VATDPMPDMAERPSVAMNGFWNAIGTAALALGGLISSVVVVRSLSVTEYGRLAFYLWLASALTNLGLLAFPAALTKIVSQLYGAQEFAAAESIIPWVGRILLLINLAIAVIVAAMAFVMGSAERPLLLILAASLVPSALARVINSRVLAQERYHLSMIASIATSIVIFAGVVSVRLAHGGIVGYEAIMVSGGLAQLIVLFLATKRAPIVRLRCLKVDPGVRRIYLSYLVPSTLVIFFDLIVWQRSEVYFLKLFAPLAEIGLYSISYTMFSTFNLLGGALLNGLFPSVSRDFGAGDYDQRAAKSRAGLALAAFYAMPIAFAGVVVAPTVLELFYGSRIAAAGTVARILMAGVLPGASAVAMTLSLNAGGHVWKTVRIGAIFAACNIALDFILIPHLYSRGAAIANTVTQLGYAIAVVAVAVRYMGVVMPWRWLVLCAVFSLVLPCGVPVLLLANGAPGVMVLTGMLLGYGGYWVVMRRLGLRGVIAG